MSFLGLEGLHAFVTGARGGIGSAIVDELLGKLQVDVAQVQPLSRRSSCRMQSYGARSQGPET